MALVRFGSYPNARLCFDLARNYFTDSLSGNCESVILRFSPFKLIEKTYFVNG